VFGVAVGSAIGDGIVASKAVESIARQPEARGNIFTFFFLGVGILEAFPIIAAGARVLSVLRRCQRAESRCLDAEMRRHQ